jgi:catechol 2,3-dioxygenase-like lactoylglutathione lyase family enzyme
MSITYLSTVTVYVSDQAKSLAFYVDQLGFDKGTDHNMGPMGRWLEVAPPGSETAIVLANATAFDKQHRVGDSADLVLEARDVTALHDQLVARGVPVTNPDTQTWGTSMEVTDPDGLTILIKQSQ